MNKIAFIFGIFLLWSCSNEKVNQNKEALESLEVKSQGSEQIKQDTYLNKSLADYLDKYISFIDNKIEIQSSNLLYSIIFSKVKSDTVVIFSASKYLGEMIDSSISVQSVFTHRDSFVVAVFDKEIPLGLEFYENKKDIEKLKRFEIDPDWDSAHDLTPQLPWTFKVSGNGLIKQN